MITIIIPVRNEEKFISNTLNSIIEMNIPIENVEILVIDGMSDDKTREIVKQFEKKYSQIKLLDNPKKTVPYALNLGINQAKGNIIIRMDAHSEYPKDYIKQLIFWKKKLDADNVGGMIITLPYDSSLKAKAIALVMSNKFGVGNSFFRIGIKKILKVDTVPFGCYDKSIFNKIGLFDTDLVRNQDDEFNSRIIKNGGKIYLIPTIKIKYYARKDLSKLFKMFFQYGLYKPLVNLKLGKISSFRQLIPMLFVFFLLFGFILIIINRNFIVIYMVILFLYLLINIVISSQIAFKEKNIKLIPYLAIGFFIIHFSYGLGYLKGIWDFIIRKKQKINNIDISR